MKKRIWPGRQRGTTLNFRSKTLLYGLGAGLIMSMAISACDEASANQHDSPVNIVWLVAEDLSPHLPAYGDSTITTPTISRLAREGVRYSRCFSVTGVCSPSRATLATGMYPSSIGALHMRTLHQQPAARELGLIDYEAVPPPAVKMVSEYLREAGYYCTNNAKQDYQFYPSMMAWDESSRHAHWRNRPDGAPFFSIFNFEVTHESQIFNPIRARTSRYAQVDFPPSRSNTRKAPEADGQSERTMMVGDDLDFRIPPYLPTTDPVKRDVRRMYSNIVELDRYMGRILDQLEDDGLLDNTIVVFYGDHGGPLPRQKRLCYDSGLQVPLIIRYPNKRSAGTVSDHLVSFVDFAPTLLSMAGLDIPGHMQGIAFAGEFAGTERKYIHASGDRFDECVDMIRAVRDDRFKYMRNYYPERPYYLPVEYRERMATMQELLRLNREGGLDDFQAQWFRQTKDPEELFDTESDPHELQNLAGDPGYADKLAELSAECDRWMNAIGDQGQIPEVDLIERFWPGMNQPLTAKPNVKIQDNLMTVQCHTEGASIGYKFESDTMPGTGWRPYIGPVAVPDGVGIEVITHRIGYAPSDPVMVRS